MSTTTGPTTIRHRAATCPACRSGIWAEVQVVTEVSAPTLDADGKAHVYATPRFLGMTLTHRCERDESGEWTYPAEETR